MLVAAQYILGTTIRGNDGDLGVVQDLLFDDTSWQVRYVVVTTHGWLAGRKVVLTPEDMQELDWAEHQARAPLTRQEIRRKPLLAEHQPVSEQRDSDIADYFRLPRLWGSSDVLGPDSLMGVGWTANEAPPGDSGSPLAPEPEGDPRLRSWRHILGYALHAKDGVIGEVDDTIVDDRKWQIRYLVGNGEAVKRSTRMRFLLSPDSIQEIDWETRGVSLDLTRNEVEDLPELDPTEPIYRSLPTTKCASSPPSADSSTGRHSDAGRTP